MVIISSKNLYKFDKDTSPISFVLTMISTEITMIMAIHVTRFNTVTEYWTVSHRPVRKIDTPEHNSARTVNKPDASFQL